MHAARASLCTIALGLALGSLWALPWAKAHAQALGEVPRVPRHWGDISLTLPEEPVTALAVDPGDPEMLFAGLDGFVFKSDDGGESWRPVLSYPRGLSDAAAARLDRDLDGEAEDDSELEDEDGQGEGALEGAVTPGLDPAFDPAFNPELDFSLDPSLDPSIDPTLDPDLLGIPTAILQGSGDFGEEEDFGELDAMSDDFVMEGFGGGVDGLDGSALQPLGLGRTGDAQLPDGDGDMRDRFPRQGRGVRAIRFAGVGSTTMYVATPRGLFRSVDTGESFTRIDLPGGVLLNDVRDVAIDPVRPSRLYVATAAGTYRSVDGGAYFEALPGRAGIEPGLAIIARRALQQDLVVVGSERGLLRSWDGGDTFREMLLKGRGPFEAVGALAFDERSGITYAGTLHGLFAGERDAAILEPRQSLMDEPIWSLSVDPRRERGVAVGLGDRGVVQSEDTGITLLGLPDQIPATTAYDLSRSPSEPDAILAGTESGAFQLVEGTGVRVNQDQLRRLVRAWRKEPTLAETTAAALAYSEIDPRRSHDMMARARWAAFLPRLQANFVVRNDNPDRNNFVVTADDPDLFDETNSDEILFLARDGLFDEAPSQGVTWRVYVLLTWQLDRTLFNASEIAAARQIPVLLNSERRIASRVRTLYGARRRLMTQMQLDAALTDPRQEATRLLRLAELTHLLSAATGGAFVEMATDRGAALPELQMELEALREADPTAALFNPHRRWEHRRRSQAP